MPATPQDHKAKADTSYTFEVDGKSYKLPRVTEANAMTIPGAITYDAIMRPDDEMAQMRLAFATLEACKPAPAAMKALKSLPTDKMLEKLGEWMGGPSGSSD